MLGKGEVDEALRLRGLFRSSGDLSPMSWKGVRKWSVRRNFRTPFYIFTWLNPSHADEAVGWVERSVTHHCW
ncbi:hypothetical protein QUF80_22895 [Desulfococcaceae bacterium HSG8]|nr:hypothetical protein [Desulfococcaceae bacterium HSG8]